MSMSLATDTGVLPPGSMMADREAADAPGAEIMQGSNLTNSQFLLWMGQRLNPDAPLYNMVLTFTLPGPVDLFHFRQAFQALIDRSDALRTIIEEVNGAPCQRVRAPFPYSVEYVDFSTTPDPQRVLQSWVRERSGLLFDLGESLFDTALVKMAEDRYVWYLNQHHLITDGWSTGLVFRYMADLYERSLTGSIADAPPLPAYADYVQHEQAFRRSPLFQRAEAYWQEQLKNPLEPIRLYGKRAVRETTRTERVTCDLGMERSRLLREIAAHQEVRALTQHLSLFNLFATVFFAYLHRISGQRQLSIGTPSHNRSTTAFRETIGVFIEIFPFQIELAEDETFLSLLQKVRSETNKFLRYAQPGTSTPVVNRGYNVLLNYINASFPPFCGLPVLSEWVHAGHGDSRHHLRLQVHDFDAAGRFILHFDFNIDLFDEAEREMAIGHFVRLLDAFIEDRTQSIRKPDLLAEAERKRLVFDFNARPVTGGSEHTVVERFEAQVAQTPNTVAVTSGNQQLTYVDLNTRANQLAHYLGKCGVEPGVLVGLCMRRSVEMVIAILGVLKAGGAYVPIDPSYPADRVIFMLGDAQAPILLTQASLVKSLPEHQARTVCLDADWSSIAGEPTANLANTPAPTDLAYAIYTSGSTGAPKGVMIEHASLANYVTWAKAYYLKGEKLDFPLFTPLSFDLTVTSVFVPLISGSRIVVYGEDGGKADLALRRVFEENEVDVVKLTPSHLSLIHGQDLSASRVKKLILGGEDLKTDLANAIAGSFGGSVEIYNEYGPTEATVGCVVHRFDPDLDSGASVPIGRPAAQARVYVLDPDLKPVPVGVVGELYLAGPGLARGYYRRPELTAERFIPDPFYPGQRMYRTGDVGRWRASGILEYLGRTDHQVKVRGYRIELGEVEAALSAHPEIEACVVDVAQYAPRPEEDVRYCARCGLPSTYPGTTFDADGVCNLCQSFDRIAGKIRTYFKTPDDLRSIFEQGCKNKRGDYDCLMLLSGGKDSTYALYQLVGMGLRVLTFTLDNGYISEGAKANIRRVTGELGVDHVFGTTPAMNAIFVDSLKRHSNVCNGCFKTLYTLSLKLAHEKDIPFIVTGLSRGQFFETRLTEELFWDDAVDGERIDLTILEARKAYHRVDDAVARLLDTGSFIDDALFEEIQFIDFYRYCDVGLEEMLAFLNEHAPWIRPSDTGRSTNCLINEVGIYTHKQERGYHNYAFPYSWDVRMGHKKREDALQELNDEINPNAVERILREIGYDGERKEEEAAESHLIAYYVSRAPVTVSELRAELARKLPEYMIPSRFVRLGELPLTPNGKIDRSALPGLDRSGPELGTAYVAPRTPAETRLAAIWVDVLKVPQVGVYDNFLELGGNSLFAIQIVSRVNHAFQVDLPLQSAFEASTVAELAALVEKAILAEIEALAEEDVQRLAGSSHLQQATISPDRIA